MTSLHSSIETKLACHGREPWLAGIEHSLIQYVEVNLLNPRGLALQSYGTSRYLLRDPSAPRQETFRVKRTHGPALLIEDLSPDSFEKYHSIGLQQRRWGKSDDIDVLNTINEAIAYFDSCPSLKSVIAHLLRNIHILEVDDHCFDLSHSDPDVPLSAFVSVPPRSAPNAPLRVCESLMHECMHLQLSLVEHHITLVTHSDPILYSPWRTDSRPPSGVLHGIYAFTAILEFLRRLEGVTIYPYDLEYIRRRQEEIEPELMEARCSLGATHLTSDGIAPIAVPKQQQARAHPARLHRN